MKHASDAILHPDQARYLEGIEPPRDALLQKMEGYAGAKRHPISDPEVASFLAITIRAARPTRAIELGTNIGYGAIVMARAWEGVHVTTIENSNELCEVARGFIREAGLSSRIDVVESAAIEALEKLTGDIDFAYIDCVKEQYPRYLELLLPHLAKGGVIVADNVLWRGMTAWTDDTNMPENDYARVEALRRFNLAIVGTPGLRGVILPLGDGVAYAVKS